MAHVTDLIIQVLLSVILIVGIYQFYFWCQRNRVGRTRSLHLAVDNLIPYRPGWVWVYSCLYYPVILYINLVIEGPRQFLYVAMSYLVLLVAQILFFRYFPVATPQEWRTMVRPDNLSERFLAFVQSLDARSNCFPSMHTSVAMLTALHLQPHLGGWAFVFPILISVSCLFTKQHFLADLPPGALLGWGAFAAFRAIY